MSSPIRSFTKPLFAIILLTFVFVAPSAFAKKDLFANDPSTKQAEKTQQLVTLPSETTNEAIDNNQISAVKPNTAPELAEKEKQPSFLEAQLQRLKRNAIKTKDKIIGNSPDKKSPEIAAPITAAPVAAESVAQPVETKPIISPTDAAQRAQRLAEGQVMNVRKFQEEDKTIYTVKLLQKNGRMKTINIDAVTGEQLEESPQ